MRPRFWIAAGAVAAVAGTVPAAELAVDPLPVHLERVDVDLSFGEGGVLAPDVVARLPMEEILLVRIDSLGRIVVAGRSSAPHTGPGYVHDRTAAVARLLADGSLDPDFGTEGVAVLPLIGNIAGIVVDPLDRVVAVGDFRGAGNERITAIRLGEDGAPDTSFAGDGFFEFEGDPGEGWSFPTVVADGSLVAVGDRLSAPYLVRLTEAGDLDGSFGAGGTTPLGNLPIERAVVDSEGRVVLQERRSFPDDVDDSVGAAVFRYAADGTPDASFGPGGLLRWPDGFHVMVRQFDVDGEGRIVARAGLWMSGAVLVRFLPDGTPDTSFSDDGVEDVVDGVKAGGPFFPLRVHVAPRPADVWAYFGSFQDRRSARGWYAQFVAPSSPRSVASYVVRHPGDGDRPSTNPTDLAVASDGTYAVIVGRTFARRYGVLGGPFVTRLDLTRRTPVPLPDLRVRWTSTSIAAAPEGTTLFGGATMGGRVRVENRGPGRSGVAFVGFDVEVRDAGGKLVGFAPLGSSRVRPLSPGASTTVRFRRTNVPGKYIDPSGSISTRLLARLGPSGLHGHRGAEIVSEPLRERPRARMRRRGD